MTDPRLSPRFDARELALLADPYPTYAELRRAGPLLRGGPGQWVVTRYAEVAALLRDPRLSSVFPPEYHRFSIGDGPAREFLERIVLDRDPPAHTRLRRLMNTAFAPRLVNGLAGRIGSLADRLLADAVSRGRFDAVADLAVPLPILVLADLLGVPDLDRDVVGSHTVDLARGFATEVDEESRAAVNAAVVWLRDYVAGLLTQRRRRPGDDLLSRMLAASEESREGGGNHGLSPEEVVDNAVFLLFAGFETTMNLIATGCAVLLAHPGQLARLRADPALLPSAVEEFLRYDAPIQGRARMVREPVSLAGRVLHPGRVVLLLLGSANRDEQVFADPARLDVGRAPNPHLSFGGGAHYCLGAALARLEGRIAFDRLLRRCGTLEPAGPPVRHTAGSSLRAYDSVPVSATRARE